VDVRIRMRHGLNQDLCLKIEAAEIDDVLLSMPGWEELAESYGYLRHPVSDLPRDFDLPASLDPRTGEWCRWDAGIKRYKVDPEQHLKKTIPIGDDVAVQGMGLANENGEISRRMILIGNRNLGNNFGFVAWHHQRQPQCFHLKGEPIEDDTYTCLACWKNGKGATIERLCFRWDDNDRALHPAAVGDQEDLSEKLSWCTYGQQVLRDGEIVPIEEIIHEFYDARHVLHYPVSSREREHELRQLYEGYPRMFRGRLLAAWRSGRPRSRYLHNAVGIGSKGIVILQRHGTIEEIAQWLRDEGADDGMILDNGGSVFTWAWWPTRDISRVNGRRIIQSGHSVFNAPDWRPASISLIAFVLKGPVRHNEPAGSVAFSMS